MIALLQGLPSSPWQESPAVAFPRVRPQERPAPAQGFLQGTALLRAWSLLLFLDEFSALFSLVSAVDVFPAQTLHCSHSWHHDSILRGGQPIDATAEAAFAIARK